MVQWCGDMMGQWHDQLITMGLVQSWYKTQRCTGLVVQSLLYPTTKQPHNNCSYPLPTMPMLNSWTFQSSSGLNTITRPTPRRSGGEYLLGQQVFLGRWISSWRKLIHSSLDPWHVFHRPPLDPGVQDSWDGQLPMGASPLQPWRVGEAQGTGAEESSSKVLVEDHQDGSNQSSSDWKAYGCFNQVYEALLSDRDEVVEDVEGGRKQSESIIVFF